MNLITTITFLLILAQINLIVLADNKCNHLSKLTYEYHGTKTIYDDARKYISKADDDELPKSFDDDSLAEEDRDLRKKDQCVPKVLYFIGRHSARFPDGEDIEQYNKQLNALVEIIKSKGKCQGVTSKIVQWRSKMVPGQDNLITELGAREERNIASRFKRIYPEFFDTKTADIKIGVTKKWRTAQTGAQFLSQVNGLNLPDCDNASLPTNDVDKPPYDLKKVLEAKCYKQMIEKNEKPFLEFHKQCEKISGGEPKVQDQRIERVKNPRLLKRIADNVAQKLALDNSGTNPPVSVEVLDSIYNMCKFENAMRDDSVWCDLFDKKDVVALEYIEDVKTYFKDAYGANSNVQQSCPQIGDLVGVLHDAQKMGQNDKVRSHFYFSHAGPMKKLLGAFELFRDESSFREDRIKDFERNLKVPNKRNWRVSLISPFSANMAFILYRCQKPGKGQKFKLITTVTEQPVKVRGCKDTGCDLEKFFAAYDSMQNCDMNSVCAKRG